jgi:hypothetical protein
MSAITSEALAAAAQRARERAQADHAGLTAEQACVIGYSELTGEPLNPYAFDDAAVILRAERLVLDGLLLEVALGTARRELVTFNWSSA